MSLALLGYAFLPGPTDSPSDLVLRKKAKPSEGFQWKGQANYDAVAAAAIAEVQLQLVESCGLQARPVGPGIAYATPGLAKYDDVLLLVCGSAPGGSAGVWARSLCMNASTASGAMFEYIAEAQSRGWAVVVADPHGDEESSHRHMSRLWKALLAPQPLQRLLVVAHSYGAALTMGLLKAEPAAAARLAALALTDGMVWRAEEGWSGDGLLHETVPSARELEAAFAARRGTAAEDSLAAKEALQAFRAKLARSAKLVPAAFEPPTAALERCVAAVGRNWVASDLPPGSRIRGARGAVPTAVSAGHRAHPNTTHAARDDVFAFLSRAATRRRRPREGDGMP